MKRISLEDERFSKFLQEVQNCLDELEEVFIFDHVSGSTEAPVETRTAVID